MDPVARSEDALTLAEETVTTHRGWPRRALHLPDLADTLNNLGKRLSQAGQPNGALAPAAEAVTIYRGLAEARPDAHVPELATSLDNLGLVFLQAGRPEEGLAPLEEAVALRRGLAEVNPDAYLPHVAASLWAVGMICAAGDTHLETGLAA
jgi:Tfp pilus assembly protein PilF